MDWTAIANLALIELGSREITSLDDAVPSARAIKAIYLALRDEVLSAHPWKCAKTRATLPADATPPIFGPSASYSLPTDPWCLRVIEASDGGDWWDHHTDKWRIEGRKIITDLGAPLQLRFIWRLEDPNAFSGDLASAIAARIAAHVAFKLTNSREKETAAWQHYNDRLASARSIDGQQGSPQKAYGSEILDSRW